MIPPEVILPVPMFHAGESGTVEVVRGTDEDADYIRVDVTITPIIPGVRYTWNGDGWPDEGGEVLVSPVGTLNGVDVKLTPDEVRAIEEAVARC